MGLIFADVVHGGYSAVRMLRYKAVRQQYSSSVYCITGVVSYKIDVLGAAFTTMYGPDTQLSYHGVDFSMNWSGIKLSLPPNTRIPIPFKIEDVATKARAPAAR